MKICTVKFLYIYIYIYIHIYIYHSAHFVRSEYLSVWLFNLLFVHVKSVILYSFYDVLSIVQRLVGLGIFSLICPLNHLSDLLYFVVSTQTFYN